MAGNETASSDNRGEALKLGTRSMFEAIERTTKSTYVTIRNKVTKRRMHVDFLTQLTMKAFFTSSCEIAHRRTEATSTRV